MRSLHKKISWENKFARKYYCNAHRFIPDMKRRARKSARRELKKYTEKEMTEWQMRCSNQK